MVVYRSLGKAEVPMAPSCVALGFFDGLHPGHRAVISAGVKKAKEYGFTPCIFTFSITDGHPASKPSSGRILPDTLRDRLLEEMGVAIVLCPPFEQLREISPEEFVKKILHDTLGAKYLFCGENYRFGKSAAGNADDLRRLGEPLGIQTDTLPTVMIGGAPVSSSRIRGCLADGDMPTVSQLLGRPFAIDFEVIQGRRLGRTIDSPTINQMLPDQFAVPRFGVYASLATIAGKRHVSVSNIGVKPTVGSDRVLSETCILGYDGDLYGQRVLVEFLEFIRPEEKFGSIEELRTQIQKDCVVAENIVKRNGFYYNVNA